MNNNRKKNVQKNKNKKTMNSSNNTQIRTYRHTDMHNLHRNVNLARNVFEMQRGKHEGSVM